MIVDRIHFLAGGWQFLAGSWPEASFSPLSLGYLHQSAHTMVADFSKNEQAGEKEQTPKTEATVFLYANLEFPLLLTYLIFIRNIRNESISSVYTPEEVITHNT